MARTLTIYNCGTSSTRDKGTAIKPGTAGELIASLYDRTKAQDVHDYGRLDVAAYNYKLIHDGPGSKPGEYAKWERDPQGVRQLVKYRASDSKARTPGLGSNPLLIQKLLQVFKGVVAGSGWEENVDSAMNVIEYLDHKPEVVNMAGWSRGGVTCHMMAHAIQDSWPEIKVNIFAVDPVPGGSHKIHSEAQLNIPSNVANYFGVLAKHDRKLFFKAAVVAGTGTEGQQRVFYLMPGVHDTVVSGAAGLLGVPVLVEHLAAEFLRRHGTPLEKCIRLTPGQICENYAVTKKNEASYKQLASQGALNKLLGLFGKAPARKNLPGGVQPGFAQDLREDCFVNDHHERSFKEAFKDVYTIVFETIPKGQGVPMKDLMNLKTQLDRMKTPYRNSFALLERTGLASFVQASKPQPIVHHMNPRPRR
jgi:hypothetical protein